MRKLAAALTISIAALGSVGNGSRRCDHLAVGQRKAISIAGTFVSTNVTTTASVVVLTDRPVADLCNGAKSLSFTGTVSASWVRASRRAPLVRQPSG